MSVAPLDEEKSADRDTPVSPGDDSPIRLAVALEAVVAGLPGGGEVRPGQVQMAQAVARAIAERRHLIVQAGTGTGKSLAYLIPAVLSGRKVVIATATKALQDQLASKDLPMLSQHLAPLTGRAVSFAVLKGRSNYLCPQRVGEVSKANGQLELDELGGTVSVVLRQEIRRLIEWGTTIDVGDRAELSWEPSPKAWAAVSVTSDACPGVTRCAKGSHCFAEKARRVAAEADVVVVNTHLYGMHLASGGAVLPDHDVLVLDEAHMVEDILSDTLSVTVGGTRFSNLSRNISTIIEDPNLTESINQTGAVLSDAIMSRYGQRLPSPLPDDIATVLEMARLRVGEAVAALLKVPSDSSEDVKAKKLRGQLATTSMANDLDMAMNVPASYVSFVGGTPLFPHIEIAPIDVAELAKTKLFDDDQKAVILTSATIPASLPSRLGIEENRVDQLDVGSPFDYATNGILYCATHLPDPRDSNYRDKLHDELFHLIDAAAGRTLALFTSYRAMNEAIEALRSKLPYRLLAQGDLPKPALMEAFSTDHSSCLFATVGFWQGIDVPGASLSLVTIDRLPFPRPDDPVLGARRDRAGRDAFGQIDLPRAATMLAQGAGRLIRSSTDRGVVAVFDKRLGNARYRWDLIHALPPFKRSKNRAEVEAFLRSLPR